MDLFSDCYLDYSQQLLHTQEQQWRFHISCLMHGLVTGTGIFLASAVLSQLLPKLSQYWGFCVSERVCKLSPPSTGFCIFVGTFSLYVCDARSGMVGNCKKIELHSTPSNHLR